jgi:FlaA1/EpsC-like NDP-sugar epimerase
MAQSQTRPAVLLALRLRLKSFLLFSAAMPFFAQTVLALPRPLKRVLALLLDAALALSTVWLALYLRFGLEGLAGDAVDKRSYALAVLLALPIFVRLGLYRAIFRYTSAHAVWIISKACLLYGLLYGAALIFWPMPGTPRSVGIIQPLLFFIAVLAVRAAVAFWLGGSYRQLWPSSQLRKALIFGAGSAGRQSAAGFTNNGQYRIVGFVDDNPKLHGLEIAGIPVYGREALPRILEKTGAQDVLLAISSISRSQKREILEFLRTLTVRVQILPGLSDLAQGKVQVQEFRDVDVDDLLGREPVAPQISLLQSSVCGQVVAITGAGGSIGSELARQICDAQPRRLLLLERSEFALYNIHQELLKRAQAQGSTVELLPLLACAQDAAQMQRIFTTWQPNTVYHAAAYKHVPMVEMNAAQGVQNNVFGTLHTALAAQQAGVANFVLISTDKAVRPTNIMGASKRVAELLLQALQAKANTDSLAPSLSATRFSMVRFGNVLGSSGSVIPLFRQQIREGEAITLTHQDVTRYFMSIPEAAQLVIQAGAMAAGGEVFVLDMGESVRIFDLAERLIALSGLRVKNAACPNGDIEIRITGLRPGEKLYEELLIGENPQATAHPRIMKAHEDLLTWPELEPHLQQLQTAVAQQDIPTIAAVLQRLVSGYEVAAPFSDLLHNACTQQTLGSSA